MSNSVNRTATPMGARRLRDWLTQPLAASAPIHRRQDAVAAWIAAPTVLEAFRARLADVRDLERTLARLSLGSGNARDLIALRLAQEQVPSLRSLLAGIRPTTGPDAATSTDGTALDGEPGPDVAEVPRPLLVELAGQLAELPALVELLGRAIADVARHHQVLCITHLAPIAAFADAHYVVSKQSAGTVTTSAVRRVEKKERTQEVARMLSGAKVTDAALKAATELIRSAHAS